MEIRFWGTRGSLPTPTTAAQARRKAKALLTAAAGRRFANDGEMEAFLDAQPFWTVGAYGGDTASVLRRVWLLDRHGMEHCLSGSEIGFSYQKDRKLQFPSMASPC